MDNCLLPSASKRRVKSQSFVINPLLYERGKFSHTHTVQCYRPCPTVYFWTHFSLQGYTLCRQVWCEHIVFSFAAFCRNRRKKSNRMKDVVDNRVPIFSKCDINLRKHTPSKTKQNTDRTFFIPVTSCMHPDQTSPIWKCHKQANYSAPRAPHNELLEHLWLLTSKGIERSGRMCRHVSKQTWAEISIPGRKQKA